MCVSTTPHHYHHQHNQPPASFTVSFLVVCVCLAAHFVYAPSLLILSCRFVWPLVVILAVSFARYRYSLLVALLSSSQLVCVLYCTTYAPPKAWLAVLSSTTNNKARSPSRNSLARISTIDRCLGKDQALTRSSVLSTKPPPLVSAFARCPPYARISRAPLSPGTRNLRSAPTWHNTPHTLSVKCHSSCKGDSGRRPGCALGFGDDDLDDEQRTALSRHNPIHQPHRQADVTGSELRVFFLILSFESASGVRRL